VYKPKLKSELILQYVVNASNGEKTSGHAIASDILERTRIDLSERSVRHHISKLGLRMIVGKITELICSQKKTRGSDYDRHA
jgi:repressor of nif and glnA expression